MSEISFEPSRKDDRRVYTSEDVKALVTKLLGWQDAKKLLEADDGEVLPVPKRRRTRKTEVHFDQDPVKYIKKEDFVKMIKADETLSEEQKKQLIQARFPKEN
jgi:hypothetical protein